MSLMLQSLPGAIRPLVDDAGSFGGLQTAIGVALDSQDRIYILDGTACQIKRFDRCLQQFVTLPCIGRSGNNPRQFFNPRGLSISKCDDLFVADTGNCRVQIFSLGNLALRELLGPLQVQISATGVSVRSRRTRNHATNKRPIVRHKSRSQPEHGSLGTSRYRNTSGPTSPTTQTDSFTSSIRTVAGAAAFDGTGPNSPKLIKPTRITLDREGRLYIIQENVSYVVVLNADGTWAGNIQQSGDLAGRFCPVAIAVDVNGNLCLSDCVTRKTYFYFPTSPGSWCGYRCCGSIDAFAASLLFDRSGNAIYTDGAAARLPA